MNAVGYDPLTDRLTDPFDGQGDLRGKRVRAVGNPLARFREASCPALLASRTIRISRAS